MVNKTRSPKNALTFTVEDYILYILSRLEPAKSDKLRLNKIAFFVEFAYLFHTNKPLSQVDYAAIDMGPVIDNYDPILKKLEREKKIAIDGYLIRPLKSPRERVPEELASFIDPLIKKYALWGKNELISLSHLTDSYKITTRNNKVRGKVIDKNLAFLETFFEEKQNDDQVDESKLPRIDKSRLVRYGTR